MSDLDFLTTQHYRQISKIRCELQGFQLDEVQITCEECLAEFGRLVCGLAIYHVQANVVIILDKRWCVRSADVGRFRTKNGWRMMPTDCHSSTPSCRQRHECRRHQRQPQRQRQRAPNLVPASDHCRRWLRLWKQRQRRRMGAGASWCESAPARAIRRRPQWRRRWQIGAGSIAAALTAPGLRLSWRCFLL